MTTQSLALSVLDLIPVRSNQTSADALAATIALARRADELGFTRYWVAEHHNMPSVASTNPPVLIGILAASTQRIRVGSGGVMLPNHAPLVVAEQFAALEAAFEGRIDLGLGRAPGSDPVITAVLRNSGNTSDVDMFPDNIRDIQALLHPDGAGLRLSSGQTYELRATPHADTVPDVWLLGSSDYSASLAARLGHAVRVRAPLFGRGHAARARPVSLHVPAVRDAGAAAHVSHGQRVGSRHRRGGIRVRVAATAAHGEAPNRAEADGVGHGRGCRAVRTDPAAGGGDRAHGASGGSSTSRSPRRPASANWPSGSRSTR